MLAFFAKWPVAALALALYLTHSPVANAATVTLAKPNARTFDETFDKFGCQIRFEGEIVPGDLERLSAMMDTGINADASGGELVGVGPVICLTGPGGSLPEAIKIAALLKTRPASTIVPPGASCESACAIAFMAGNVDSRSRRALYPSSRLGLHAPKLLLEGGSYSAERVGFAYDLAIRTIAKVSALDVLPNSAMTIFASTPASEMHYVATFGEIRDNAIDLVIEGASPGAPHSSDRFDLLPSIEAYKYVKNACEFVVRGLSEGANPRFRSTTLRLYNPNADEPVESEDVTDLQVQMGEAGYPVQRAYKITANAPIHEAEESYRDCLVDFTVLRNGKLAPGSASVTYGDVRRRVDAAAFWSYNAPIDSARRDALGGASVRAIFGLLIKDQNKNVEFQGCAINAPFARVINVDNFVNVRSGASLSDTKVTKAIKGARVQVIRPNTYWYKDTSRGRACDKVCKAYGRSPKNPSLIQQARQCVDDKIIWAGVNHNGRSGYVSVYFLEAIR